MPQTDEPAKRKMGISEKEPVEPDEVRSAWIDQFLVSLEQGDMEQLLSLLTEDVMFVADAAGKSPH